MNCTAGSAIRSQEVRSEIYVVLPTVPHVPPLSTLCARRAITSVCYPAKMAIVMKFGGTSVEDAAAIERSCGIVGERITKKPFVIVSALGGATNGLLEAG